MPCGGRLRIIYVLRCRRRRGRRRCKPNGGAKAGGARTDKNDLEIVCAAAVFLAGRMSTRSMAVRAMRIDAGDRLAQPMRRRITQKGEDVALETSLWSLRREHRY
jgi:hypothetical protein